MTITATGSASQTTQWFRVADLDELPEGRVKTVVAGHKSIALTHYNDQYGALDNRCPHQGGPLGEGSIENGFLRCPWHGWDYCQICGGFGVRVTEKETLDEAIATALAYDGPAIVEIIADPELI